MTTLALLATQAADTKSAGVHKVQGDIHNELFDHIWWPLGMPSNEDVRQYASMAS